MKVKREKHRAAIALPGAFFACVGRGAAGMSGRARERAKFGGGNVKILLPETEVQGLAGSGEQREVAAGSSDVQKALAGMWGFCSPERSCKG